MYKIYRMNHQIHLIITVSFIAACIPIIKKYEMIKNRDVMDVLLMEYLAIFTVFFCFFVYQKVVRGDNMNVMKMVGSMDKRSLIFFGLFGISVLIIALSSLTIVKENKAVMVIALVKPLSILMSLVIGYVFYKEMLNRYQMIGMLFVLVGIFIITKNG